MCPWGDVGEQEVRDVRDSMAGEHHGGHMQIYRSLGPGYGILLVPYSPAQMMW